MTALDALIVEDSADDAELLIRTLRAAGFAPRCDRVEDAAGMAAALTERPWQIVLSDYSLPGYGAEAALAAVKAHDPDLPFVVVSGSVGDDKAAALMRAGASDWISKDRLARLGPAVERELREAEVRRAAAHSEASYRALIDSLDDLVFTTNLEGRFTGVFGRGLERLAIPLTALVGRPVRELVQPDELALFEAARARVLGGEAASCEIMWSTPAGPRSFLIRIAPRRNAAGAVIDIVGVARDVTDLKQAQTQLAVADRMSTMGALAAGVAHEINNPLACALLNLELAKHELAGLTRAAGASAQALVAELTDARAAIEQVRQISSDLRLFARSDDRAVAAVDLVEVLRSSSRMAWNQIRHRAALVEDLGVTPPVTASASRLGQVFLNLLVNAAQAIPESATATEHRITIRTRTAADGRAVAEVADTGVGMTAEVRARLFTPLFTTKPPGVGTGLGLSISKRIVDELGGAIEVDSAPGRGTTFRLLLPAAASPPRPAPVAATTATTGRRGHVLVVDDEPMIARAVERALRANHDVVTETRPLRALGRIEHGERFDVILCDLMMPEMAGMELYRRIGATAPEQAAAMIFMTGGAFSPSAHDFLDSVGPDRLEKPFDPAQVLALVSQRIR